MKVPNPVQREDISRRKRGRKSYLDTTLYIRTLHFEMCARAVAVLTLKSVWTPVALKAYTVVKTRFS
jgi:hypothetical protein